MNETNRQFIIILDGSKGAGKTTVANVLKDKINAEFLSLDEERRALPEKNKSKPELNKQAFEVLFEKSNIALELGQSIAVDCGLTPERVERFEGLAQKYEVDIYKFLLKAPFEHELERVKSRDKKKQQKTDKDRFEEVYDIVHGKNTEDFIVLDTSDLTPEQIAEEILNHL